jgi:hypothetical protein
MMQADAKTIPFIGFSLGSSFYNLFAEGTFLR